MKKLISIMAVLTMLLLSCQSSSKKENYNPVLYFPDFPKLETFEKLDNDMIAVPEKYILELADFKVLYEELEKNYDLIYNCN